MRICVSAIGIAMLAGLASAHAQGTSPTTGGSSGHDLKQCWDVGSKVVRDRSGTTATGPSGNTTVGSTTSPGSSGSTTTTSSGTTVNSATSANAGASTRPSGMPDC
jgi:hypothetical protein